jgi:hypothetical protein
MVKLNTGTGCIGASLAGLILRLMALLTVTLLTVTLPAPARTQAADHDMTGPAEVAEYADWSLACDNLRRCEAVSESRAREQFAETEWGEMPVIRLRVVREAGPGARARILVDRRVWAQEPLITTNVFTLHVLYSGDTDVTGPAYRLTAVAEGQYELAAADVPRFLAESARSTLAATRLRGSRALHGLASTEGLNAALRAMDAAQGSSGTVTALIAKGPRPASAVPRAQLPPAVAVVRASSGSLAREVADDELRDRNMLLCGVMAAPHAGTEYRLANGDRLWRVDCPEDEPSQHIVNLRNAWLITKPDGRRIVAPFPGPPRSGGPPSAIVPNSFFDPDTGLVTATFSAGPHSDCGWRRQWGWTGHRWRLVHARAMPACLGIMPDGWLTTWRTSLRYR